MSYVLMSYVLNNIKYLHTTSSLRLLYELF